MNNNLYNLADFLDQIEIDSLKNKYSVLLENKEKIKKFLTTNYSLKQQIDEIKNEFDLELSIFSYRNFLLKYFKESYEEHNINKVFLNCKVVILDLILNKNYNSSMEIYKYLLEKGMLKKVKNDDTSIITYDEFILKLEEYITIKNLSVKIDTIKDESKIDEIVEEIKEENIKEKQKTHQEEIDYDLKVDIELTDGTLDPYNLGFLTYSYIFKKHSKKKYDFDEKNYFVIPPQYNNMNFDFQKIKKIIIENNLVKNYSLIFHDNKINDGFLYIYRIINNKFHLLEKIASRESSEFEDYYKNGIKNYLNIFDNILDKCIED